MKKVRVWHWAGDGLRIGLAVVCLGLAGEANATPSHAGRPFVLIARTGISDPVAGFINGFGRAQAVGDSVVFVVRDFANATGVFRGRGGPIEGVAQTGTSVGDSTLGHFHDGFARDTTASDEVAIAAGATPADGILLTDGTAFTTMLPSGTLLPNSGGKMANVIGEPYLAGGNLAVIAWHDPGDGNGPDFRGVYRVAEGALETVADTATELPGELGVPDTFSSQVGFDGETLAFWASRGPFTEVEGMFVQDGDGTMTRIAGNGDGFPGGGTIDGLISPPVVSAGAVYFFAWDAAFATRLLKYEAGGLTELVQDGDVTSEGDALQSVGQFGLAVEGGRVFFPALTSKGAGLYLIEEGAMKTIVAPGTVLGGILPTALVLQDVAEDTVVMDAAFAGGRRLVANLAAPAPPVIVGQPVAQTVAPGARVELKVTALGEGPLTYAWRLGSQVIAGADTDTLVIEHAGAADVGYYQAIVSNALGTAYATSALVNVEVAPEIISEPIATAVETGDQLTLRVIAAGGLPLSYDWRKDGQEVVNDSRAAGYFSRVSAGPADAGIYTVTVSNAYGEVTSIDVPVTVNPAPPNPVYAGGRLVSVLDAGTPVPGTELSFDLSSLTEFSIRLLGDDLAFVGGDAANPSGGVFRWSAEGVVPLLTAGEALANGLGAAGGYRLIPGGPADPLTVAVTQLIDGFQQPVGLYRFGDSGLSVLADVTLAAPGGDGALFPKFWGWQAQAGGTTLFLSKIGEVSWLHQADADGVAGVVSSQTDLPELGTQATQFQGLAWDGDHYVLVAATGGQAKIVALRGTPGGGLEKVLAKGDPLPGTALTVGSIGTPALEGGSVFLFVYDSAFQPHVVEWRDGELTHIAGAGMDVDGMGTLQSITSSYPTSSGGRCHLSVRVTTPEGSVNGIVSAGADGIQPLMFVSKLDGRRIDGAYVAAVTSTRLVLVVHFTGGGRALYANVGGVDDTPLQLDHLRLDAATLRLSVPEGAVLEATGALGHSWEGLEGVGTVDLDLTQGMRYFRLRRE